MGAQATYDDVNLILRLFELRREEKIRQARDWFAKNFKVHTMEEFNALCPPGSDANAYYRMLTGYWEMAASFVTAGVLHKELFFESGGELLFVWERAKDVIGHARKAFNNPNAAKNLETVAKEYIEWMNGRSPGAYEAFSKMVHGR